MNSYAAVNPMLAVAAPSKGFQLDRDFPAAKWAMELKLDGVRCIVQKVGLGVYGRHRATTPAGGIGLRTAVPAHIQAALQTIPGDFTLDCELVVGTGCWDVLRKDLQDQTTLVAFDVISAHGLDLRTHTYDSRRQVLELLVAHSDGSAVRVSEVFEPSMAKVKQIWASGGEGVILKRRDSRYQEGKRSPSWVKLKNVGSAELTIKGFEAGQNGPHSVVLLEDAMGQPVRIKTLATTASGWHAEFARNAPSYIGRRLVISYRGKTESGAYRHPMWDHFIPVSSRLSCNCLIKS